MKKVSLGKSDRGDVMLDVVDLITSRMLLTAMSGGGKSHALRRLLEQTYGMVQHIILDPEGEFVTLREKFDYVVAGKGGDCAAEPRSAALLARRVLELGVSIIVDISELDVAGSRASSREQQTEFVKRFLDALVEYGRKVNRQALVVLDEAHLFAPEGGKASSTTAVANLASLGRKRGLCAVLATQRLSKLDKDVAAELGNVLIGRTGLDLDKKRAGDMLGFGVQSRNELSKLAAGQFWCYGAALEPDPQLVMVGPCETAPPPRGAGPVVLATPSKTVRSMLAQLADLPAEAEAEARTIEELKRDNANLRRELTKAKSDQPQPVFKCETHPDVDSTRMWGCPDCVSELRLEGGQLRAQVQEARASAEHIALALSQERQAIDAAVGARREIQDIIFNPEVPHAPTPTARGVRRYGGDQEASRGDREAGRYAGAGGSGRDRRSNGRTGGRLAAVPAGQRPGRLGGSTGGNGASRRDGGPAVSEGSLEGLKAGARKILTEIASRYPAAWTRAQVGALTGFAPKGGTFGTYLGELKRRGFVIEEAGEIRATDEGLAALGGKPPAPTSHDEAMEMWRRALKAGCFRMLEAVVSRGELGVSRGDLAEAVDMAASGGTFGTYLGILRRNGLVVENGGFVVATDVLFPEVA